MKLSKLVIALMIASVAVTASAGFSGGRGGFSSGGFSGGRGFSSSPSFSRPSTPSFSAPRVPSPSVAAPSANRGGFNSAAAAPKPVAPAPSAMAPKPTTAAAAPPASPNRGGFNSAAAAPASRTTTTTTTTTSVNRSSSYGYNSRFVGGPVMYGGLGMGYGYSNGLLTGLIIGNMMHPHNTVVYSGGGTYNNNALLYPDGRVVNQQGYQVGTYVNGVFTPVNGGMVAQAVPADAGQYQSTAAAQPVVIQKTGYSGGEVVAMILLGMFCVMMLIFIIL